MRSFLEAKAMMSGEAKGENGMDMEVRKRKCSTCVQLFHGLEKRLCPATLGGMERASKSS